MNPAFLSKAAPDGSVAFLPQRSRRAFWRYILVLGMVLVSALLPRYAKAATYTIGSGASSDYRFPINTYYGYSYSQSTYLASELVAAGATLGSPGYINSISFNITYFPYDFSYSKDWAIYMGNTAKTTFSGSTDWVPSSTLTKVFDGTVSPTGTGWFTITLSTPFYWDGSSNIIIGVDENTYWRVYDNCYFASTSRSGIRSIGNYDYYSNPDPVSPMGAYRENMSATPDVEFDFTPASACSGTIAAGSAVSSATTLCSGSTAYFDVTGSSTGEGISYEWESSPSGLAGTWTSISGATSSIFSTVPPAATTTYYRRKITCSHTASSDFSTPVAVSVSSAIVPPYTEDFESATVGVNIPCASYTSTWSLGGIGWYIYDGSYCSVMNHTAGGSKYLLGGYGLEVATGNQDFWFTPPLDLGSGKTYRLSYWHANDGYSGNNPGTGAYIGTAQSRSAMTAIGPFVNSASTTYKQYVTDFSVPSSGIYYAGIRVRSTYNCSFGIDDINLIELPDCNTTTSLGKGGKAAALPNVICSLPGSTTLSLTETPPYSGLTFSWEVASGTPASFSSAGISTASGSYSITTGGIYYFRCVITCSATGVTTYSDTVKVLTTPITPPYIEDFESARVPDNLPCASYSPSGYWHSPGYYWSTASAGSPGSSVENHTTGGSKLLLAGGQLGIGTGEIAYWYTPGLSLVAGKAYDISFWYKTASYGSWMDSYNYQIGLAYGSSQSSSAMTRLDDTTLPHSDMKSWKQFKRGFVASTTGVQYIGILANSSEWVGYGVNVDDIGVEQLPPCAAQPVAGKTVSNPSMICSSGTAFLTLKGTSAASDLTFQWQESPTGLPGTWVDAVGGSGATTPGYTTPSLSTSIYYRCVVICGLISAPNADTSTAVRLQVGPIVPPYIEDFETATAGVNQPCAAISYADYGFWESSTATGSFNGWGIKDKPGTSSYNANVRNHTTGGKYYLSAGQNLGDAYFGSSSPESEQQYWFSPPLQLAGGGMAYRCNYWYVNNSYPWTSPAANYGLYYGTAQDPAAMRPIRSDMKGEINTDYKEISGTIRPISSGIYYLGVKFRNTSWASSNGHAIDDIGVTQLPLCTGTPVAGTVEATPARICSSGTADLSLTGTTEASMISFQWQESTVSAAGPWYDVVGGSGATSDIYTTDVLTTSRWYRCIVICAAASVPNTDTTDAFFMEAGAMDLPYVEDFETTVPGEKVICSGFSGEWGSASDLYYSTVRGTPASAYTTIDQHTPGGSNMLWLGYGLAYSGDNYWWTPGLNLEQDSTYEFSYWYNGPAYPYSGTGPTLGMYYGTEQSDWAMMPIRPDVNNVNISSYKQMIGRFISPGTGVYYFGIKVNMPSWMDPGIAIDDIGINQLPACTGAPTVGTISVIPAMLCSAGGTAELDMDLGGVSKVAGLKYTWYASTTGPTGPWAAMSGTLDAPSFTTLSLPSTTWFYCEVKCNNTGDTSNSSVIKIDVGVIIPPYIETFETNISGSNMPCASNTAYWSGPTYAWYINSSPVGTWAPTADNHTPGGSKYLQGGYALGSMWSFPGPQYWFSPAIRFTGGKLYQFTFWYNGPGVSATGVTSTIGAYYGTSQSAAAMTTAIGPDLVINQFTYKQYKKQFTPTTSGDYYIGLKVENAGYDPGVSFDDIGLQEVPPCSAPVVAGTIVADPGHICSAGGSAVLDLEGSTLATGLTYDWMAATSPAGPYTLTGTGLPYNTDPLSANTWFRVVVTCAATGATDTSEVFKVGVGGMSVPYSEDFEKWATGQKPICSDATYWGLWSDDGWRLTSGDVSGYGMKNHTPGGKNYMWASYYLGSTSWYSPLTDDNYWFTPGLALDARYKYAFSFWYQGNVNFIHRVGAFYGNSQSVAGMTNTLMTFREINSSAYTKFDTIFKPATSGTYYIGLKKATESLGFWENSGVAYDDINLNYAPCDGMPFTGNIYSAVASGSALCLNTPVTLIDTGATINLVPGIQYQWMRRTIGSGGTWSPVAGATDTVLKADTLIGFEYKFGVICGNTNDTAYSPVFQLPALPAHPPVSISPASTPASFCLGDTVKFNATNYTSAVYDWMIDSVVQFGWKFSDMGATEPGEYMVRVTSPLSPCPAYSNKVKLEINDPGYAVEITKPADSIICEGTSLLLTAMASKPGVTIKWRKDNVDIPFATSSSYLVTTSGYYRAVASDGSSMCPAVTRNIHIIVQPNPDAKITIPGGTLTACENEGVVLKANAGYSYQWLRGGLTMSGSVDDSLVVKNSGVYSVKVRTAEGCMDVSTSVTVNILPSPDPVITKMTLGSGGVRLGTTTFLSYQWYRNGVKIPGATAQTLDLFTNGIYKVVVTGTNSCEGTSELIEIDEDGLGIDNGTVQTDQIRIYPNPTQSKVFIESPVAVQVSVKDITGRVVLQSQEVKEVDLSKYADGVYLFTISDKEGNELIKQQRVTKFTK